MLEMAFCFDEIESHGNYRVTHARYVQFPCCIVPILRERLFFFFFFLSELEAKPMPHCTSRGKKLHIHI